MESTAIASLISYTREPQCHIHLADTIAVKVAPSVQTSYLGVYLSWSLIDVAVMNAALKPDKTVAASRHPDNDKHM